MERNILDLMKERAKPTAIRTILQSDPSPAVTVLNNMFECQWCWEIINTGDTLDGKGYAAHGRLYITGIGFRDGLGIGATPSVAGVGHNR